MTQQPASGATAHVSILPMKGIRIINFGWYWVCATISQLLSDMGAEVVKIDSRQRLEVLRGLAPFLGGIEDPDHNLWFHNLHRNTWSATINLNEPRGRELIRELVRHVDIVAENWTPGTMKKLGLDYETLRKIRPDLIMISPSAAGQTGPLRGISTYGTVLSPLAGIDALQGYEGERPYPFGTALPDPWAGVIGAYAVLAALKHRNETGEGRYIDFGQWEALSATLGPLMLDYQWNGRIPGPMGNRDPLNVPNNVYPCVGDDKWVAISIDTEDEWQGLCRGMGDPDWCREPRFADKFRRKRNEPALDEHIAQWTQGQTHKDVAERLQQHGVAASVVAGTDELYLDDHWKERETWLYMDHPLGKEAIYGVHWKFSDTPGSLQRQCPLLGEDNDLIWGDLVGLSQAEVQRLKDDKVIY